MEARIAYLKTLLDQAEVVDSTGSQEVDVGTVVQLRHKGDDEAALYVVGSLEEASPGLDVISPRSPIGLVMIGRRAGETVQYSSPGGEETVEILAICA